MPLDATWPPATDVSPPSPLRRRAFSPRLAALSAATLAVASVFSTVAAVPASATLPCADGSSPQLSTTVTCGIAGNATLTVPAGTTSVDVDLIGAGGGAGYPARSHIGGNAAEVTGTLTLPAGTAYLYVVVGAAGTGDNHGTSSGGGASAVLAEDSGHNLLAKLAIAGGGGGGAYNGDGGNAGSAGTSDNAQAVSGPGQGAVGAVPGAGGTGNYAAGTTGGTDNPSALAVAAGGTGGLLPSSARGGGGGGGYAGGGGGGASTQGILNTNVAGGGGGSSLASSYLGSASVSLATGTGGVQLPGLVAGDGATGTVTLTFNGVAVPGAPTGVTATPGDGEAAVSFEAPANDGGSTITSYTVTAAPGGVTATCPGSPCTVTGLTNGTSYTFTVIATNDNGASVESSASNAVTPAEKPGAPTAVTAIGGNKSASVSWTAPASDGGSEITGYTVTSSPGGKTKSCSTSPCVVTGLENGTDYTFSVVATNAIGDSTASEPSAPTHVQTVPDAPSITKVVAGDASAAVTFTAPAQDGGAEVTGYTVVADPGGLSKACSDSPCTITGLTNGTTYTLRVVATNAAGSSEPSDASEEITPATVPDAPTGLTVDRGDTEATLTFEAPQNNGGAVVTGFEVSTDGGQTWTDLVTQGAGPYTGTVTGLSNGNKYEIAVRAVNRAGHGAATEVSNVTPAGKPGAPSGVSVTRGDEQVTVSWTSPNDNGSAITGYEVHVVGTSRVVSCPASPCDIDDLVNGTSYQFEVRALNDVDHGSYSDPSDAVVPATTPKAPELVDLFSGDGSLTVTFTPPSEADNGGDAVTGYEYSIGEDGWKTLASTDVGNGHRLALITGLENGKSLSLRLRSVNGIGGGDASEPLSETPATIPGSPTSVKVSSAKGSTTVSWKAPTSDGGSPIVEYAVTAQPGGALCEAIGEDSRSCTFTTLTAGSTYTFSVVAVNTVGHRTGTGLSDPEVSDPTLVTDVPTAPAQLTATPGDRTATLTFSVPASDGGKPITGYEVSTDGGLKWEKVSTTAVGGSSTERTTMLGGLLNGSTYQISVRATNADGAGAGTPPSSTYLQPWFTDPISPADRATEIPVPAKPSSYKGKLVHTVATNRANDDTVATNGSTLAKRQLQPGQAVQVPRKKMFTYDTAKLTKTGKATIKAMVASLTYVRTVRCEAYADYAGSKKHSLKLTKARAKVVCDAIEKDAKQVSSSSTVGYGEDRPVVVGGSKSQRSENRRVVVVIEK